MTKHTTHGLTARPTPIQASLSPTTCPPSLRSGVFVGNKKNLCDRRNFSRFCLSVPSRPPNRPTDRAEL
jgi:hypothetical protein